MKPCSFDARSLRTGLQVQLIQSPLHQRFVSLNAAWQAAVLSDYKLDRQSIVHWV